MKKIILMAMSIVSLGAFAQTVYLDGSNVNVDTNPAILVKTSTTPNYVTLNVKVPTTVERCEEADMRVSYDMVTDGARCGYDTIRRNCGGGYYPGRVGPSYNPPRRGIRIGVGVRVGRGRVSIPAGRVYNGGYMNDCSETVARTCRVETRYCSKPYSVTVDMYKTFNLEFLKFNEDASIDFSLDQNYNLKLDVLNMSDSCLKTTIYGDNGVKTGAKIKLKSRCR